MTIHVVRQGETIRSIAAAYGVDALWLAACNAVDTGNHTPAGKPGAALAVGQTLVVRFPAAVHTVRAGDTLTAVAGQYGVTVRDLWRRNWPLGGGERILPGQTLVITYRDEPPLGPLVLNGYAYPFTSLPLLNAELPYLTFLTPFTYGIRASGALLPPRDAALLDAARRHGTGTVLHLSTLTEDGGFDTGRGRLVLTDSVIQDRIIEEVLPLAEEQDFAGVDVDFEYLPGELAAEYAAFLARLRGLLRMRRKFLWAALAPKVRADQPGLLYEAHDYAAVGRAVDAVLLMTYEWGYTAGPPMAVSPLPNVRAVLDYAVTEMEPGQIFMGLSNYGYDWTLPYVRGTTLARSISNQRAVQIAAEYGIAIQYDERAQSPYFHYTDAAGAVHEVWFEDARSIAARLGLIAEYGLQGAGVWNATRPFSQIWQAADAMYSLL